MLAALLAAVAVAACGSPTPEASRPPKQILTDVQHAIRTATGYAFASSAGGTRERATIEANGGAELSYSSGAKRWDYRITPAGVYFRGNTAYWQGLLPPARENRWFTLPASAAKHERRAVASLTPAAMARCLARGDADLRVVGGATRRHAPHFEFAIGARHGGTARRLTIPTSGAPLPVAQSDRAAAGAQLASCNGRPADRRRQLTTYSRWNAVGSIAAPRHRLATRDWPYKSPTAYDQGVCQAGVAFVAGLKAAVANAGGGAIDVGEAHARLVNLLDTTITIYGRLAIRLRDVGIPDVPNGATTQRDLFATLARVRAVFVHAQSIANDLSSTDPYAFNAGVAEIQSDLRSGVESLTALHFPSTPQLDIASAGLPVCRSLLRFHQSTVGGPAGPAE